VLATLHISSQQVAAICICLPVVVYGAYLFWQAILIRDWRETQGTIIRNQTNWELQHGKHFGPKFRVKYTFSLGSQRFEGTAITAADLIFTSGMIFTRKWQRLFPSGKEVSVFYNPDRPSRCLLVRPSVWLGIWILASGLACATLLVVWAIPSQTSPYEPRPAP